MSAWRSVPGYEDSGRTVIRGRSAGSPADLALTTALSGVRPVGVLAAASPLRSSGSYAQARWGRFRGVNHPETPSTSSFPPSLGRISRLIQARTSGTAVRGRPFGSLASA